MALRSNPMQSYKKKRKEMSTKIHPECMSTKQIKTEIYGVKCAKDIKKIYKA